MFVRPSRGQLRALTPPVSFECGCFCHVCTFSVSHSANPHALLGRHPNQRERAENEDAEIVHVQNFDIFPYWTGVVTVRVFVRYLFYEAKHITKTHLHGNTSPHIKCRPSGASLWGPCVRQRQGGVLAALRPPGVQPPIQFISVQVLKLITKFVCRSSTNCSQCVWGKIAHFGVFTWSSCAMFAGAKLCIFGNKIIAIKKGGVFANKKRHVTVFPFPKTSTPTSGFQNLANTEHCDMSSTKPSAARELG